MCQFSISFGPVKITGVELVRKLSMLVLAVSLAVGIVGMARGSYVKVWAQYMPNNQYQWFWYTMEASLFEVCTQYPTSADAECQSIRSYLESGRPEWLTVVAFLIMETVLKGCLLFPLTYVRAVESNLTTHLRTFRIVMAALIITELAFGAIAVAFGYKYMTDFVDANFDQRGAAYRYFGDAYNGSSLQLALAAYLISVGALVPYCIAWMMDAYQAPSKPFVDPYAAPASSPMVEYVTVSSPSATQLAPTSPPAQYVAALSAASREVAQQHVSLVIDGQVVTALLIPAASASVAQPVNRSGPIVYLPNSSVSSYTIAPQAPASLPLETSPSAHSVPAHPSVSVSQYPSVNATSCTA